MTRRTPPRYPSLTFAPLHLSATRGATPRKDLGNATEATREEAAHRKGFRKGNRKGITVSRSETSGSTEAPRDALNLAIAQLEHPGSIDRDAMCDALKILRTSIADLWRALALVAFDSGGRPVLPLARRSVKYPALRPHVAALTERLDVEIQRMELEGEAKGGARPAAEARTDAGGSVRSGGPQAPAVDRVPPDSHQGPPPEKISSLPGHAPIERVGLQDVVLGIEAYRSLENGKRVAEERVRVLEKSLECEQKSAAAWKRASEDWKARVEVIGGERDKLQKQLDEQVAFGVETTDKLIAAQDQSLRDRRRVRELADAIADAKKDAEKGCEGCLQEKDRIESQLKDAERDRDREIELKGETQRAVGKLREELDAAKREIEQRGQEIADAMGRHRGMDRLVPAVKAMAARLDLALDGKLGVGGPPRVCVGAVIVDTRMVGEGGAFEPSEEVRVILGLRKQKDSGHGLLVLPGGGVSGTETLEAAVKREVKEETGLVVRVAEAPFFVMRHVEERGGPGVNNVIVWFRCVVEPGASMEPVGGDDLDVPGWYSFEQVAEAHKRRRLRPIAGEILNRAIGWPGLVP